MKSSGGGPGSGVRSERRRASLALVLLPSSCVLLFFGCAGERAQAPAAARAPEAPAAAGSTAADPAATVSSAPAAAPAPELPYGRLISDGSRGSRRVALTFDDGPGQATAELLDLLKARGVRATFFVLGRQARRHAGLLRRIAAEGHQVACHSDTHPDFTKVPARRREALLRAEIAACRAAVEAEVAEPIRFLRMPYGYDRPWVKRIAAEQKLVLVNWTFGMDWTKTDEAELLRDYARHLHGGAILLFHDGGARGGARTARVVKELLDRLERKALEPVRIDTLLGLEATGIERLGD